MDQVPSRSERGEETGDEVEGVEGLGLLVVVAVAGRIGGGRRPRREAQAGEAHGVAQAIAGEGLEGTTVTGRDGHGVVDREAGVAPGQEEAGAVLVEQAFALEKAKDLVSEQRLGSRSAQRQEIVVQHRPPSGAAG